MRESNLRAQEFRASLLAALNPMLAAEFIPKLTCFDVRDRGEVIRLIFEETATHYNERRVSISEWPSVKSNFIISQLPVYEEGDLFFSDIGEICRHISRKLKLSGSTLAEQQRCEEAHELLMSAVDTLLDFYWDPSFAEKRELFEKTQLFELLFRLENHLISNSSSSGFWVGENLTYIDLLAWYFLDCVAPFSRDSLVQFPKLGKFKQEIENRRSLQAYLSSDRRPKHLTLPLAFFGADAEDS